MTVGGSKNYLVEKWPAWARGLSLFETRQLTTTALLIALMVVSAYIVIPVGPIPVTLQSGVVLLSGALLGRQYGAICQSVYVAMGLIGLPVLAGGRAGPGMVFSPSFGYLIGFIAAAYVTGALLERRDNPSRIQALAAMTLGALTILLFGAAYLALYLNVVLGTSPGWIGTLAAGVLPFLVGDAAKVLAAAAVFPTLRRLGVRRG